MEIMKVDDDNERSKYVPDDIWFEVRSRLPFKSHLSTRLVGKSWKKGIPYRLRTKFKVESKIIPIFGIFVSPFNFIESPPPSEIVLKYIFTSTKRVIKPRINNTMDPNLIISSGCERGLWSDMSFDFSPIRICNTTSMETNGYFFTIDGGLLLVTFKDGTSQVHNPATKQVIMVPKSKLVEKYNLYYYHPEEVTGIIVNLRSKLFGHCRFFVIRFCRRKKIIEVYHSSSRSWRMHTIKLNEVQLFDVNWRTDNCVAIRKHKGLYLFILTINRGIAIQLTNSENIDYGFPLPKDVLIDHDGTYHDNIRISGSKNVLHLLYYNSTGLSIWKAGSTQVDKWTWIPLLVISDNCKRLCKPIGRRHLSKLVLNPTARVIPLCCHPSDHVAFLLVKSSIFAYNFRKDTIERVVDMNDEDDLSISLVLPFQPCLNNFRL